MRSIATPLILFALAGQAAQAREPPSPLFNHRVAACQGWGDAVRLIVRRLNDLGLLPADDASAENGLIDTAGRRCSGGDAARISAPSTILLETLVEQINQPRQRPSRLSRG